MKCLSPAQLEAAPGFLEFSVNLAHADYRKALVLAPKFSSRQTRLAAQAPLKASALPSFSERINRWLPSNHERLLWVDHWNVQFVYDVGSLILAARSGLGECRKLEDAPGHLFSAHLYDKLDFGEMNDAEYVDCGLLAGLISMMIVSSSDGWLVAPKVRDRIGFWEGNVLFYSEDAAKLDDARTLLQSFNCKMW